MRPIFPILAAAMSVAWAGQTTAQDNLSFRDDFTGSNLAPEFKILNPDPDRMALVEGDFLLLLPHKDTKNVLTYTGELPEDYEIVVRFATVPSHQNQGVAIRMSEGENGVQVGLYYPSCCHSDYEIYFNKTLSDENYTYVKQIDPSNIKPVYLKILKSGVEYAGSYSFDGSTWTSIGKHASVRPYTRPRAYAYLWKGDAPETPMKLDFFEVVDLKSR